MKKILLLFITLLTISTQADAQKLFSKEWKEKQLGKDSVSVARKQTELAAKEAKTAKYEAQQVYSIKTPGDGLSLSGQYMKKSVNSQIAAYGISLGASIAGIAAACVKDNNDRNILLGVTGGLTVVSVIFQIKAIQYKFKAGQALEFTGNKLQLVF